jgi:hypothetical protein
MAGTTCAQHRQYTAGCPNCQRVTSHYERHRRTAIRNGTWQYRVPAHIINTHITNLRTAGMSLRSIARAAGLAPRTVYGTKRCYIHGPTAAAILAVTPPPTPPPPAGMVDATGIIRRIQALVTFGYPLKAIAAALDRHLQQVWEWAHSKQPTVAHTTARAVAHTYERLSATIPPPGPQRTRAQNTGRRNGWPPPLAWDTNIDDPAATPHTTQPDPHLIDEVLVARVLAGTTPGHHLNRAERAAAARAGLHRGMAPSRIADLIGAHSRTVHQLAATAA